MTKYLVAKWEIIPFWDHPIRNQICENDARDLVFDGIETEFLDILPGEFQVTEEES